MDPKIRYAKSADGTNIAYWAIGEGPALVYMPTVPWCHVQREWSIPEWRRRYERLATGRTLIRFDARGFGLSDPRPRGVAPADHADDIDAVLDALGIAQCDLLAIGDAGFAAVEYCARATGRVARLVLWGAYVSRAAVSTSPNTKSLRALWDEDWLQYTEMAVRTVLGWKHEDRAAQLVDFYRAAASPESLRSVLGPLNAVDLTALLPAVQVPTLVVALDDAWLDMRDEWRRLATELPNAELRTARGETLGVFDFYDEEDDVVTILNDFLGGGAPENAPSMAAAPPPLGGLRTVLFTDLVGHTEMMQRLGDERGRDVLREHERITRETLKVFGGAEVKTLGDGFMASFGSVTKAMDCAIALQRALAAHDGEPLNVRVGLNAGEPIEEDGDLFGSTVILASRIAAQAAAGEILVPDTVRGLLSGKGFVFGDRGEFVPKGFDEGVRLWDVRWQEAS
jgi:class 3 adenylate cyclase/pimeloyl-ACP methyl ester carboxylesterase